jgi:hypothetical protein
MNNIFDTNTVLSICILVVNIFQIVFEFFKQINKSKCKLCKTCMDCEFINKRQNTESP